MEDAPNTALISSTIYIVAYLAFALFVASAAFMDANRGLVRTTAITATALAGILILWNVYHSAGIFINLSHAGGGDVVLAFLYMAGHLISLFNMTLYPAAFIVLAGACTGRRLEELLTVRKDTN